jgi:hypothetical protein
VDLLRDKSANRFLVVGVAIGIGVGACLPLLGGEQVMTSPGEAA